MEIGNILINTESNFDFNQSATDKIFIFSRKKNESLNIPNDNASYVDLYKDNQFSSKESSDNVINDDIINNY